VQPDDDPENRDEDDADRREAFAHAAARDGRIPPERGRLRSLRRLFAPRAREWTVEASSWAPYPITKRWTTTRELRGQVLASVEGQLARGEEPVPRNAKQVV